MTLAIRSPAKIFSSRGAGEEIVFCWSNFCLLSIGGRDEGFLLVFFSPSEEAVDFAMFLSQDRFA
jgi:hypothetical protein